MAAEWFYQVAGAQFGPVSPAELQSLARAGAVTGTTPIRKGADGRWLPARQVQGLFPRSDSRPATAARQVEEKPMQFPVGPLNVPTQKTVVLSRGLPTTWFKRNPRRARGIAFVFAGCILAVLIASLTWRSVTPTTSSVAPATPSAAPPTWLTISYADLLDRDAIIRTGQDLGSALRDSRLRNAIQPFVDGYSQLLPAAIEIANGPDQTPCHNVLDFFAPGERQPAWVAILRGGRIHIVTDDKNHAKVFLLGDDPQQVYSQNYSVVRHCLSMLSQLANGDLNVDVFAYHNDYANSELRINTTPYSFQANAFEPRKPVVTLDAIAAFFAEGPEIQGAALNKDQGLIRMALLNVTHSHLTGKDVCRMGSH